MADEVVLPEAVEDAIGDFYSAVQSDAQSRYGADEAKEARSTLRRAIAAALLRAEADGVRSEQTEAARQAGRHDECQKYHDAEVAAARLAGIEEGRKAALLLTHDATGAQLDFDAALQQAHRAGRIEQAEKMYDLAAGHSNGLMMMREERDRLRRKAGK